MDHDAEPPLEVRNEFGSTPLTCCLYGAVHSWRDDGNHVSTVELLLEVSANTDDVWLPNGNEEIDNLLRAAL